MRRLKPVNAGSQKHVTDLLMIQSQTHFKYVAHALNGILGCCHLCSLTVRLCSEL